MSSGVEVWTVLVAAGSGSRFGGDKLAEVIESPQVTVLDRSIRVAAAASSGVVVVTSPQGLPTSDRDDLVFVGGGATRSDSVRCGLAAVPPTAEVIVVHDAARPLAGPDLYERVVRAVLDGADAAVPALEVVDTIRSIDGGPVDREHLRAVQTPQAFLAEMLRRAHAARADATDDASLVEAIGGRVVLVDGDVRNLKITRPGDLDLVRALLVSRR